MNTRSNGGSNASNEEGGGKPAEDKQPPTSTTRAEPCPVKTEVTVTSVSSREFARYAKLIQREMA